MMMSGEKKYKSVHCKWCSAIGCSNSKKKNPDLTFFRFPADPKLSRKWVIASRRADLDGKAADHLWRNNNMCEEHFEPISFRKTKRKLLTKEAVPTQFKNIKNQPLSLQISRRKTDRPYVQHSISPTVSSSTDSVLTESIPYESLKTSGVVKSLKRKLANERVTVSRLRSKVRKLTLPGPPAPRAVGGLQPDEELELLKDTRRRHLPERAAQFVLSQIRIAHLKNNGRRWTYGEKSFALAFYHTSRKAYSLLQKIFAMPSPRTLSKAMNNINIRAGFCPNLLKLFTIKIQNMSAHEKLCVLLIDEMALKKSINYDPTNDEVEGLEDFGSFGRTHHFADHALVFMVRGLAVNWKQPLGYVLSKGATKAHMLKLLVLQAIKEVNTVGLNLKVVIWDQGSNNRSAMNLLGVSNDAPYITIEDKKIFMMYDPPHLIKSVRNNFKAHGYTIGSDVITWDHINQFYTIDSSTPIRMAPKLTNRHITLPPFANLKVSLAVQVLSRSVAAGMCSMVRSGELPIEASTTSTFIKSFDDLFDCFNSRSQYGKREISSAITSTSMHINFLHQKLEWIQTIQCRNKTRHLPCLKGWELSINCVLQLWGDLSGTSELPFFLTSRLNQDALENLFSVIRGKGGHRCNPDPREFRAAVTQTMVDNILLTSESSNCKPDVDSFLFSLETIVSHGSPSAVKSCLELDVPSNLRQLLRADPSTPALSSSENNTLVYISGYVAMKLKRIVCDDCNALLCQDRTPDHPHHSLLTAKQYNGLSDGCGLTTPSIRLLNALETSERSFRKSIASHLVTKTVRYKLIRKMLEASTPSTLNCPRSKCNLEFLVYNLYTNIRLHYHLKCLKRDLAVENARSHTQKKAAIFRHQ